MESNSKEETLLGNEETDRFSDLPDSILCKILSHLPTKIAVATSILSTRWKNFSPFDYPPINLDLDDSLLLYDNKPDSSTTTFMAFVDKLLCINLRDVPRVHRMTLKCEKNYSDEDIVSWVSAAALRLNVRELHLDIFLSWPDALFDSLSGCVTLVSLELVMKCVLDIPEDFSLPSLKRLYLGGLEFTNCDEEDSINEFIEGCPVLEELRIIRCRIIWLRERTLSIRCPLLKSLAIENTWIESRRPKPVLRLHAPNLETWMYRDSVATGYFISTFKSLTEAHIDVDRSGKHVEPDYYYESDDDTDDYDDYDAWKTDVSKVIAACSSTKRMYLSECSVIALHHPSLRLPHFENLTWLSLGSVRSEGWLVLACLLCNAPNLEHLTIEQKVKQSEMGYADFKRLVPRPPICLELHLKKIEFRGFEVKEDFMLLVYFLLNGKVLQKVVHNSVDIPIREVRDKINSIIRKKHSRVTNIRCNEIASVSRQRKDSP